MYLGFSLEHSSLVSNVMNIRTGHVGPQYHLVVDDLFTSVPNASQGGLYDPIMFDADRWKALLDTGYENHLTDIPHRNRRNRPALADDWLTGAERRVRRVRRAAREARSRLVEAERNRQNQAIFRQSNRHLEDPSQGGEVRPPLQQQNPSVVNENESDDEDEDFDPGDDAGDDDLSLAEGEQVAEEDPGEANDTVENETPARRTRNVTFDDEQPQRVSRRTRRPNPRYKGGVWAGVADARTRKAKVTLSDRNQEFLAGLRWANVVDSLKSD